MKPIEELPKNMQVICSLICKKWQENFMYKLEELNNLTKDKLKQKLYRDMLLIEILTEHIEKMNDGKIFTDYNIGDFEELLDTNTKENE